MPEQVAKPRRHRDTETDEGGGDTEEAGRAQRNTQENSWQVTEKIHRFWYCDNFVGMITCILNGTGDRLVRNIHHHYMHIMTKWVKTSIRTGRPVWLVQKMTSLDCNVAFKTRKRQHLGHITI